ncbi:MAG: RecX family transcriptional regulator [Clostridia bacterium]|nr:RecX family transcriptional regulator [Clostridia bacterium]
MSKITSLSIQEKNKNRCNIFIDGDFFMGVPIDLVYKYSLKVGMEIDSDELKRITNEKDYLEAFEKATNYLSKYLKTKKQVQTYLLGKGYSLETANNVISKLIDYGFINDKEFAKRYIESNSNTQGVNLLKYKLMMKGLRKEDVSEVYEDSQIDSKENAKNLALKKMNGKENTKENLAKVYRYLISKGFTYEDATFAIDFIKQEQ